MPKPHQDRGSAMPGADEWLRASGPHYLDVIERLQRLLDPDWYLEIGTGRGNSLARGTGKAICVDPDFRVKQDVIGRRAELHFYRQTSDDFFASGAVTKLTDRIDLTFIDGMHLFENVLRDFINTEKLCHRDSVVLLHDLVPFSAPAATREWDPEVTKGWSGDVWKMTPILRKYRPDLDFTVLDPRPSGLGLVSGLDPENRVLDEAFDEIVAAYRDLTIEDYGLTAFREMARMTPVMDVLVGDAIAEGAAR